MSRLEWLQMKRTCASYGPPLTPYEQVELFRLEAEHADGCGHQNGTGDYSADERPEMGTSAGVAG